MTQYSYPFNDQGPTSDIEWSQMFRDVTGSGVRWESENSLKVYADSSGPQVKVAAGEAHVRGHFYRNTSTLTVPIAANASGQTRHDLIVARLEYGAVNNIRVVSKVGVPGAGKPPSPVQTEDGIYELPLGSVVTTSGFVNLAAGSTTDRRIYARSPLSPVLRGTSAQRNAYFGSVATLAQQGALHNAFAQWYNTELGYTEQYFARESNAFATVGQELHDGFAAGWYPAIGGAGPRLRLSGNGKIKRSPGQDYIWSEVSNGWNFKMGGANCPDPISSNSRIQFKLGGNYRISARLMMNTGTGSVVMGMWLQAAGGSKWLQMDQFTLSTAYGQPFLVDMDLLFAAGDIISFRPVTGSPEVGGAGAEVSNSAMVDVVYTAPPLTF